MRQLLATIALALVGVGAGLHAQSTALNRELILAAPLPDSDGDGRIKLGSARAPFKRGETVKLCPATAFRYVLVTASCEPVAAPTPTPEPSPSPTAEPILAPTFQSAMAGQDGYVQGDFVTAAINRDGTLGARTAAPAGFRTHLPQWTRAALFDRIGDVVFPGRTVEGFALRYPAKTAANFSFAGFTPISTPDLAFSGSNVAPDRWLGSLAGVAAIDQRVAPVGRSLTFDVGITNTGTTTLTGTYFRAVDLDTGNQGESINTTSRVLANGWANTLSDGRIVDLTSDTPGAFAAIDTRDPASFNPRNTALSPLALGYTRKGDHTVILVFPIALAPGEGTRLKFGYTFR